MRKLLSILALFCLTVTGAWADDDSGSCGTSATYSYEESTHTLTISGRNIAMQQMAQAVYDLVERLPKQESDIDKSNSTTKTTSQPSSTPSTSRGLNYPNASIPDNI